MTSPAPAYVAGAAYSGSDVAASSSYAALPGPSASHQPRRAVMLKGPSITSKTYFVPLPATLDQLVARAVELFPMPPGKVPHITLGADERAIVLQESYDFIRDRELLFFRWTAETPRRNLANRVRWDQPQSSASATPTSASASSSSNVGIEDALPSAVVSAAEALKAQLQGSPSAKRDLAAATRANTIANRDPSTQFGEGAAARKAHAQRVLAEQQRKRDEEHTADALGAAPVISEEVESDIIVDADPEAVAKAAFELAPNLPTVSPTQYPSGDTEAEQPPALDASKERSVASEPSELQTSTEAVTLEQAVQPSSSEVELGQLVHASAADVMSIESPPRKKQIDNGGLDTPPSSGSRSSSPFHSSDRASVDHRARVGADDEPSSSPISSPSRDVSSRHKHLINVAPIPELVHLPAVVLSHESEASHMALTDSADSTDPFAMQVDAHAESTAEAATAEGDAASASPTELVATKPRDGQSDRELNRIYSFLSNLVSQLLSHKANWAFQRPMSVEFEQFAARSSRPVDLFTIRDSLAARRYGSQHLEGRMAANAVVTEFEDDLSLLYSNARHFFGIRSTQAECVEHLEKFSRSFLNEYKRTQGSAPLPKASWGASSDLASARLSAFRSPGSRPEKHAAPLPSSAFSMLLTPRSNLSTPASSSAAKRTVGNNAQSANATALGMMRRPDFGFARNVSYDSSMAPAKRAQPTMTTSEAFEKALRAASATPQSDRIKPRQDTVAPFPTRSVIESDFMTRLPLLSHEQAEQQTAAQTTPSASGKRQLFSTAEAEPEATRPRTPSMSPPPSPSPTKRNKLMVRQKQSKSTSRRNKKRSKNAKAAPAGTSEQDPSDADALVEAEEESSVAGLLDAEPARKRGRTTKAARAIDEPEPVIKASKTKTTHASSPAPEVVVSSTPSTPGRMLRPRKSTPSTNEHDSIPPPKTPPRSCKKTTIPKAIVAAVETLEVEGFEVIASTRRSSRQRKPVNLD